MWLGYRNLVAAVDFGILWWLVVGHSVLLQLWLSAVAVASMCLSTASVWEDRLRCVGLRWTHDLHCPFLNQSDLCCCVFSVLLLLGLDFLGFVFVFFFWR